MILKVRTVAEKRDNELVQSFMLFDGINELQYTTKAERVSNKEEVCKLMEEATRRGDVVILNNGRPNTWDYSIPFPYSMISFLDRNNVKKRLYFNTEAYICNDKGNTLLARVYGY